MVDARQLQAIRFYEGDVAGNPIDGFWNDAKAYVTWNALLFDGIATELARTREKRMLNAQILEDPQRLIGVTCDLLSAFQICRQEFHVRRVERLIDYQQFLKNHVFSSFVSTSKAGFLDAYTDKRDLVLLELDVMPGTPFVDFENILDDYRKADESEVLLAPFTEVVIHPLPLPSALAHLRDCDNNPVCTYANVEVSFANELQVGEVEMEADCISASKRCYAAWNRMEQADPQDIAAYLHYKKYFQNQIKKYMKEKFA